MVHSIGEIVKGFCYGKRILHDKYDRRILLEIGSQGATGLSILGINAKALPSELVLPGGHILASATMWLYLAKDSMNENRVFSRIRKFIRRRR